MFINIPPLPLCEACDESNTRIEHSESQAFRHWLVLQAISALEQVNSNKTILNLKLIWGLKFIQFLLKLDSTIVYCIY